MANTLNYSINNKEVSFTGKSLTIDGQEFLYKDITAIKHSSAKSLYLFKVDGKWHELYYDQAHKKNVSVIFKKIYDHLATLKDAKAAKAEKPAAPAPAPAEEPVKEETPAKEEAPAEEAPSLVKALEETEGLAAEEPAAEEPAEEAPAEEETKPEEDEETEEKPEEEKAEEEKSEEDKKDEVPAEKKEDQPDELAKKKKRKKAILIFAIIIAIFAIAGVIYYFAVGLPSESTPSDGQDTHQYNDIEELIDEMQD